MVVGSGCPRATLKWLLSLDLSLPIKQVRRDFSNGFLFAEMFCKFFPHDISLHSYDTGSSLLRKKDNWKLLQKVFRRHDLPLSDEEADAAIKSDEQTVLVILERVRKYLTSPDAVAGTNYPNGGGGVMRHPSNNSNIIMSNGNAPTTTVVPVSNQQGLQKSPRRDRRHSHGNSVGFLSEHQLQQLAEMQSQQVQQSQQQQQPRKLKLTKQSSRSQQHYENAMVMIPEYDHNGASDQLSMNMNENRVRFEHNAADDEQHEYNGRVIISPPPPGQEMMMTRRRGGFNPASAATSSHSPANRHRSKLTNAHPHRRNSPKTDAMYDDAEVSNSSFHHNQHQHADEVENYDAEYQLYHNQVQKVSSKNDNVYNTNAHGEHYEMAYPVSDEMINTSPRLKAMFSYEHDDDSAPPQYQHYPPTIEVLDPPPKHRSKPAVKNSNSNNNNVRVKGKPLSSAVQVNNNNNNNNNIKVHKQVLGAKKVPTSKHVSALPASTQIQRQPHHHLEQKQQRSKRVVNSNNNVRREINENQNRNARQDDVYNSNQEYQNYYNNNPDYYNANQHSYNASSGQTFDQSAYRHSPMEYYGSNMEYLNEQQYDHHHLHHQQHHQHHDMYLYEHDAVAVNQHNTHAIDSQNPYSVRYGAARYRDDGHGVQSDEQHGEFNGFNNDSEVGGSKVVEARVVDYQPYTLEDYEELIQDQRKGYWELGKLGPDYDPNELAAKREMADKRKAYARNLRALAHPSSKGKEKNVEKQHSSKILSSRERARQFAKNVPKPKVKDMKQNKTDRDNGEQYCAVTELERLEMQHKHDRQRLQMVKAELNMCIKS